LALRIATRGSALALTQARAIAGLLGEAELVQVGPDSREVADKSRFVRGVEAALLAGEAEIGVHSAKDLPSEGTEGLRIAGVPPRAAPADAWVGPGSSLDRVAEGSRVGTASVRRRAQLLAARPDLEVLELRGNVDTRLRKLAAGDVDALVLAAAGLARLGRGDEIGFPLDPEQMTPAPGQGTLVLQAREGDSDALAAAAALTDPAALVELTAERAAAAGLGGSCATPIGILARNEDEGLVVDGFVGLPDGSAWVRDRIAGSPESPAALGEELARRMLAAGAEALLAEADAMVKR
jgi:hydroxymethylbilane synthase